MPARRRAGTLGGISLTLLTLIGAGCRLQQSVPGISDADLAKLAATRDVQIAAANNGGMLSRSKQGQVASEKGSPVINLKSKDAYQITMATAALLSKEHYTRHPVDGEIAGKLLTEFLDYLDPQHLFFTQADVQEFEPLRNTIAQQLMAGDATPAQVIFDRFRQRVGEDVLFAKAELKNEKFDFTGDDTFVLDRKKTPRPANAGEQKNLWLQRLRYEYLQEKLNKQTPEQIITRLGKRYDQISRNVTELDSDDVLEQYLTTLAHVYDPHSDYFGHSSTETFNIQMRLSLVGIGAQLQSEDGYVKIMELTPGGPAQKSNKLKPGDRIVAVTQEGQSPVDVVDMKIDKVVELIRGPKGTPVTLTILPADAPDASTRRKITLVRDEIKLEDSAAKARIIETPGAGGRVQRIGYIDLPSFYADPDKKKSATTDVALLIKKLKAERVSGIILDLRRNGGGSLNEAISMTGLFIKNGPVVQVRDQEGKSNVYQDDDAAVAYDGPLVVMTSHLTASASEIVAGALQDYGRAVIVGDTSTFGKGTVQTVLELSGLPKKYFNFTEDPGSLKLTIQKFYRPSGKSTQLKGVESDIVLPSVTEYLGVSEKNLDNPLPYDTIAPAPLTPEGRVAPYLATLRTRSRSRVASDVDMMYLRQIVNDAKKAFDEKTVSLNEANRRAEKDKALARSKARQAVLAARKDNQRFYSITLADAARPGLPPAQTAKQLADANRGPERAKSADDADSDPINATPERDILLDETERILTDYAQALGSK